MKKEKIVLSAITALSIVGGAFASKVKRTILEYVICDQSSSVCVTTADAVTMTDAEHAITTTMGTMDLNAAGFPCDLSCPSTLYFTIAL